MPISVLSVSLLFVYTLSITRKQTSAANNSEQWSYSKRFTLDRRSNDSACTQRETENGICSASEADDSSHSG